MIFKIENSKAFSIYVYNFALEAKDTDINLSAV